MPPGRREGNPLYLPIRDYALIGDCHGAALVSRQGSVDWCSLGRFDADPVFCRLLDARQGGFLSVRPESDSAVERDYLPGTNILRTTFSTPSGKVRVTDFMPVGRAPGSSVHDYVTLAAPFWLVRRVEGLAGSTRLAIDYRPTVDFARRRARLTASGGGIATEGGPWLYSDVGLEVQDDRAAASVDLHAGEVRFLVVAAASIRDALDGDRLSRLHEITRAFWTEWAAYCRYDGPYGGAVLRSALTLKLLTYAPSGAIVAAPTTSLPEEIGGARNWDYRYAWLRDASFTLYALGALGYSGEARQFAGFLMRSCRASHPRVQIMYGIEAETDLSESALDHLDGYRGSRPVRVGNGAYDQHQLDVYGEVLDWALLYRRLGGRLGREARGFLDSLASFVATHWEEPEQGIWEMRGPARHHVYGKIMSWVALDRAIRLFGDREGRAEVRERIRRAVLERGVDPKQGNLVQIFGETQTDAALLLTPMVGFPIGRPMLVQTVEAVERELRRGDYLLRYHAEDGLPGSEGAFLICSFWLVDALLAVGRAKEARSLYERLLARANDVGLYAEEIDPATYEFLGNFPQAFTHLAVIQSAVNLDLYAKRGAEALRGTLADRARHAVEATAGPRALWAAFKRSRRVGRIRSSRASILRGVRAGTLPGKQFRAAIDR